MAPWPPPQLPVRLLALHMVRDQARLDALVGAGLAAYKLAHTQRGDDLLSQAVALAQELGRTGSEAEALLWLACNRMHTQDPDGFQPLLQQGLPLARRAGDQRLEVLTLMELGRAPLDRRQLAKAQHLFLQSTMLGREAGCVIETPTPMQHAGLCALKQQQFDAARRLRDDAAALRDRQDFPSLPADRAEQEARQAQVRAQHPRAAFDKAFAQGRGLSREDAIHGALGLWPA